MVVPGLDRGPAKGYEDQAGEDLETGGQQEDGLPRCQRLLKIILKKCRCESLLTLTFVSSTVVSCESKLRNAFKDPV